jgi:hypothetical protein
MGTAEEPAVDLHAMPDDPAAALLANRCQPVDGALERVEHVDLAGRVDLERHPVIVTAYLTSCHTTSLRHLTDPGNRTRVRYSVIGRQPPWFRGRHGREQEKR